MLSCVKQTTSRFVNIITSIISIFDWWDTARENVTVDLFTHDGGVYAEDVEHTRGQLRWDGGFDRVYHFSIVWAEGGTLCQGDYSTR